MNHPKNLTQKARRDKEHKEEEIR